MIRITLVRRNYFSWNGTQVKSSTIVKEFEDHAVAANWFIEDSYFDELYTESALWEQILE